MERHQQLLRPTALPVLHAQCLRRLRLHCKQSRLPPPLPPTTAAASAHDEQL
jgi:hypothetical protein